MLREYGRAAILQIKDIREFVAEQHANLGSHALLMPLERVYGPADAAIAARLRLSE